MTPDQIARLGKHLRRLYTRGHVAAVLESPAYAPPEDLAKYKHDPVGFAREVLGITLTPDQQAIVSNLPGRVKVNSGHALGKTAVAAVVTLWWFFTRNPAVVVTTAPTRHHVETVLWSEIRLMAMKAIKPLPPQFLPKAAKIWDTPDHWAEGVTAASGEGFQGRHRESMLFVFDESEDIDPIYWTATDTMYQPGHDHGWLAIGNPVTTSSQSYLEDMATDRDGNPKWTLFNLSALNHPNIAAELAGLPPPIPNAVSVRMVDQWVESWTDKVYPGDQQPTDVEWPPGSKTYYRPGPTFKARVQGIRPSEGVDTVWSAVAWDRAVAPYWHHSTCWENKHEITIGVDCAAYGDDDTVYHVRSGPLSLHHEAHNGWPPDRAAGRLKELCREYAALYNSWASSPRRPLAPNAVKCVIESDGGYGLGVLSHRDDFRGWESATMGGRSEMVDMMGKPIYYNNRAQMWCEVVKLALAGNVDLSRLPAPTLARLRLQLLTPYYEIRGDGSRLVESKKDIKQRLGRSPDDADAFLLSHFGTASYSPTILTKNQDPW